jgi:hypothetical protein
MSIRAKMLSLARDKHTNLFSQEKKFCIHGTGRSTLKVFGWTIMSDKGSKGLQVTNTPAYFHGRSVMKEKNVF